MSDAGSPIEETDRARAGDILPSINGRETPLVLRGLCAHWPLVQQADQPEAIRGYLTEHDNGSPVTAFVGPAEADGRLFYTDDLSALNFTPLRTRLSEVLQRLRDAGDQTRPETIYMGSTALDHCLPSIKTGNSLPAHGLAASTRIWIGNRSRVAAHHDVLDNIACVCAGRRRFTLFPPEQLINLYLGPLDLTPAGQQISLVDPERPDFERYPRYADALDRSQWAELAPGDAIYIPSMWWHQVTALADFNILINHWWRDAPAWMGAPQDVLKLALLNLAGLPRRQRLAWRALLDHYVLDPPDDALAHIPEAQRGMLGGPDEERARRLRAELRNSLNR